MGHFESEEMSHIPVLSVHNIALPSDEKSGKILDWLVPSLYLFPIVRHEVNEFMTRESAKSAGHRDMDEAMGVVRS
jgi:hypothetical protein